MSANAISAQGATVQISSTSGSAKNISAAAAGYPTVITATGHGLAAGDIVAVAGITGTLGTDATNGINGKSFVITNVTTNTFAIAANTTGLTYTSGGTATPTAWTTVGAVQSFKTSDQKVDDIDRTDLSSTNKEYFAGLIDLADISMDYLYDSTDAGQTAIATAFAAKSTKSLKITWPNSKGITFTGYFNKVSKPDAAVNAVMKQTATLKIQSQTEF